MPDNFGQTLRDGSARFAEGVTPGPVGLVRARGDRRRRRKAVAGSAVIAVAVIAGGVGGFYGLGQPGRAVAPVNPRPVTSVTAPAPTSAPTIRPTSTPSGGATRTAPASQSPPASTASSGYGALAGYWQQTDGALETLYIFPDGLLGVGQGAGANDPLCAGQLQPRADGAYPFEDACGVDGGTAATNGTITVANQTLTMHIPGVGGAASTLTWKPVTASTVIGVTPIATVPLQSIVGTWRDGGESITVASTGAVTWSFTGQQGQTVSGAGTVEHVSDASFRITTSFGSPRVAGVWPIAYLIGGQLAVTGGEGTRAFTLTGG